MAISLVQTATPVTTTSTGTSSAISLTGVGAGNTLIIFIASQPNTQGTVTSVTSTGNTVANTSILSFVSGQAEIEIYYILSAAGGSTTATVNWSANGRSIQAILQMREYSGIASFDKSHSATGSSTALSSGATVATTTANELVVGLGATGWGGNTYTVGTGYGHLNVSNSLSFLDGAIEDKIVAATGTQTATLTVGNSASWVCGVATFAAATVSTNPVGKLYGTESFPVQSTLQSINRASRY